MHRVPRRPTSLPAAILALPAIVVLLFHSLGHRPVFVDDAYIFYRYASNWAAGLGLVYNPGEYVEGYSSLLWTLLLAAGAGLSVPPDVLAPVLGAGFAIGCLVLSARAARRAVPDSVAAAVVVPIACSLSTGFAYYAISGMDTSLFATVVLASVMAVGATGTHGRMAWSAVCLVSMVVVRAEGFLYALVLLSVLGVTRRLDARATLAWRRYGLLAAIVGAAIVLQFGGRWLLYGEWTPATVSAKAYTMFALRSGLSSTPKTLGPFIDAILDGLRYEGVVAPLAVLAVLGLIVHAWRRRTLPLLPALLAAAILVNMATTISASGDWMDYHRHIVPVWPAWLLLLAWSARQVVDVVAPRRRLVDAVVTAAVLAAGWHAIEEPIPSPMLAFEAVPAEGGRSLYKREVGSLLHEFGAPVTVVTNVAGKLPYYAGPRTYALDLLGLTDEHNATRGDVWSPTYGRTDFDYSFGRPFDLLVTNSYADLERLLAYSATHARVRTDYALYAADDWTANCFFVVAKPREPLGTRLQNLCACRPRPLDEHFLERVRAIPLCSGIQDGL